MKNIINISLFLSLCLSSMYGFDAAQERDRHSSVKKAIDSFGKLEKKEVSTVDKFRSMFVEGEFTAQIRTLSAANKQEQASQTSNYATALGGTLKYELASFNGFNAGVAMTTSQDIRVLTGAHETGKQNPELSSSKGNYTQLSEAYLNYKYQDFNLRAGRQIVDTPLADSDDVRMIQNTFNAYLLRYELNNFSFLAGNIMDWQGSGAGLDEAWVSTGPHGVWLSGMSYSDKLEGSLWYYDISAEDEETKALYCDFGGKYLFNDKFSIHGLVQYLKETQAQESGVQADIYGVLLEGVAYGVGVNIAYNKSLKHNGKRSFAGIGGGALFTSMDTLSIDAISEDREASALVFGLVYNYKSLNLLYAYGDFVGKEDSANDSAHLSEQNIGVEYNVNKEFIIALLYSIAQDLESKTKTEYDFNRAQVMLNYNF